MYAQRTPPAKPPCGTCRVDLLEENRDAGDVFSLCRDQVITAGMGDVIGISIPAIKDTMDICNIRDQKSCLQKVLTLFYASQKNMRVKNESC